MLKKKILKTNIRKIKIKTDIIIVGNLKNQIMINIIYILYIY